MARRITAAVCVLAALLLAGCGRTIYDKTVPLTRGNVHEISVDPPSGDQKVGVEFSSPGAPIDVWVLLATNQTAVKQKVGRGQRPDDSEILAGKEQAESGTVEATVPAGKEYLVILSGAKKKTDVKVKVTGK